MRYVAMNYAEVSVIIFNSHDYFNYVSRTGHINAVSSRNRIIMDRRFKSL
jgi:hypothetical protein